MTHKIIAFDTETTPLYNEADANMTIKAYEVLKNNSFWQWWIFSGVRGEYVDVDIGRSIMIHVRYGDWL